MITKIEKGFLKASANTKDITEIWSIKSVQNLFTNKDTLKHFSLVIQLGINLMDTIPNVCIPINIIKTLLTKIVD